MIGRNVSQELPYILRNVERLGQRFAVAHVVLVEVRIIGSCCHHYLPWMLYFCWHGMAVISLS